MTDRRRVLLLGAGLVSRPLVDHFLERPGYEVVVGSLYLDDAEKLVNGREGGRPLALDVTDDEAVSTLVADADVVVSLVPYAFHPRVAQACVRHRRPMVTASYVSPEMQALDGAAREAGVALVNEIGLDPGLDHLSAMRLIRRVQDDGGRVTSFVSCAGGLPAPEASDNPWHYKFSWSPRGVLLAGTHDARYLQDGEVIERDADAVFREVIPYPVEGLGLFESYANRDSLKYVERYGLDGIRTMRRGTIRFPGWAETINALRRLGLLEDTATPTEESSTWAERLAEPLPAGDSSLDRRVAAFLDTDVASDLIERLRWAGLLDETPIRPVDGTRLDQLASLLGERMSMAPGERDLVILRHELEAEWPDRPPQRHVSLLVVYGHPDGDTAMARTVSLPAAAAAERLLDGGIAEVGVLVPSDPHIGGPILDQLERGGLRFREWAQRIG